MSRFAHCVFCDDVRQEIGGKMSLMGIYGTDLIITGVAPIMLPKLVIPAWVICDLDDKPSKLTWTIKWRDGAEILKMDFPALDTGPHREGATQGIFNAVIQAAPFPIEKPGVLEVYVETEKETLLTGRLYVQIRPPAEVAAQTPVTE
jgi:hypothetical protein